MLKIIFNIFVKKIFVFEKKINKLKVDIVKDIFFTRFINFNILNLWLKSAISTSQTRAQEWIIFLFFFSIFLYLIFIEYFIEWQQGFSALLLRWFFFFWRALQWLDWIKYVVKKEIRNGYDRTIWLRLTTLLMTALTGRTYTQAYLGQHFFFAQHYMILYATARESWTGNNFSTLSFILGHYSIFLELSLYQENYSFNCNKTKMVNFFFYAQKRVRRGCIEILNFYSLFHPQRKIPMTWGSQWIWILYEKWHIDNPLCNGSFFWKEVALASLVSSIIAPWTTSSKQTLIIEEISDATL